MLPEPRRGRGWNVRRIAQMDRARQLAPGPADGMIALHEEPRATTCGRSSASPTVRTRPQGMPAGFPLLDSHSSTLPRLEHGGQHGRATLVVDDPRGLVAKRGSSASAGSPIAAQNDRHSAFAPDGHDQDPSAASKVSYGARLG